jgi:cell division protein FtsI/penicillin-binding protein 2
MVAVGIACAVLVGAMAARLFSLTVVSGGEQRAIAEGRLDRSTLLPTVRGSILDRKGRELARSVPSYDLAVFYPAINGAWVDERALAAARKAAGRAAWNRMGPSERGERIAERQRALAAELDAVLAEACAAAGISRDEVAARMGEVRTQVEKKANAVWEARLDIERAKYGEEAEDRFEARPIAEQGEPRSRFASWRTRIPGSSRCRTARGASIPGTPRASSSTARGCRRRCAVRP